MRIIASRTKTDLRFKPVGKKRRLQLATAFEQHELEIPCGYPYEPPHELFCDFGDARGEAEQRAEDLIRVEVFGREAELLQNWLAMRDMMGQPVAAGFVSVARYYFDQPFDELLAKALRGAACRSCGRKCAWGVASCCCTMQRTDASRSPNGRECVWCQDFPSTKRSVGLSVRLPRYAECRP